MNSKKMFLSLIPWVLFSVITNRRGADAAAIAALAAAGLSLLFLVRGTQHYGVKIIDVTGVVTFGALAVFGFVGGHAVNDWIADYGRGSAAMVLAVIMLGSALTVPFTEAYARESVPRAHWGSPVFRSVNRRISALWGGVVAVMGLGHLLAGLIDPATNPVPGARPVDLVLNWAVPIALILFAIKRTEQLSDAAGSRTETAAAIPAHYLEKHPEHAHHHLRRPTQHQLAVTLTQKSGQAASGDVHSRSSESVYSTRPGSRVVTSWTNHKLPSGSVNEQNDP